MKKMYSKILQGLIISCMALSISQTAHAQSFTEGFENIANLTDWYVDNNSDSPSPTFGWGTGNPATFPAQAGTGYLSCNYQSTTAATGATISNWLFTPSRVYNNGDVITFYTRKPNASFPDRMQVRLSTNGASVNVGTTSASVGDFTNLLLDINPTLVAGGYPTTWTQYTITISGLPAPTSGRIAFRYFVTNAGSSAPNSDYIGIDTYTYTSTLPAPANDNCLGAAPLTHAATCTPTSGTILGASASGGIECGDGTANDDVWYQFQATSANAKIIVDGSTNFDAVFEVSSGSCGALTTIACVDNTVADGVETIQLTGLTVGQTYFIRVYDWYDTWPTSFTFNICVQQFTPCALTQPVGSVTETEICGGTNNDACATPQSISCGTTIWGKTWSSVTNRDVDWYSFTVTTPTSVTLAVQSEVPVNAIFMNIANCATPVQLASGSMDCTNGTVTYNFTTAGTYGIAILPQTFAANACGTSNDYIATLTMATTAPVLTAGGPITFCPGGSVSLSTTATGTFAWYNGTTLIPTATTNTYVATTNGSYTVVVTNSNGCPSTSNAISVTVNALDNATFAYGVSTYCVNGTNPTPTAATPGTYSSTAGLNFVSAATGQINLATSTAGTYTVTHTTTAACPNTSTQTVTITALDNATFAYGASSYCVSGTNPTPTAATPGTYSSTAGLNFVSAATGQINLATSTLGTYTITHTTTGACPNTSTQTVTITALDNATFAYGASAYCLNGTNPTPTAATPGTYSSTAGLNFVSAATGQINLATSTAGTYTITHTTTGTCSNTSTQTVTVTTLDNATFAYGASAYCVNGTNPTPTAATPGTYSSTVGLNFVSAATGQINLATSTAGTYTITHTTTGTCPNTSTQTVTINALPTVTATPVSVCAGAPAFTLTNGSPAGGNYSGTGVTGNQFNPAAGTQTVTYSYTNGNGCTATATATVTVTPLDNANFTYSGNTFCSGSSNPTPTTSVAGTFSSSPGGLNFVSTSTGQINMATSASGSYTVTYTTSGACPNTSTQTVTITSSPNANFSYGSPSYCVGTTNPSPTFTGGATAGTFSSTTGLVFVSTGTGVINLATSTPGTYTVTNTIAASGSCPTASATATVTINARPTAVISGGGALCVGSTNTVNITGTLTGTSPWSVVVSTPLGNQTIPSATNTLTIPMGTVGAGTYTIVSVTDANCTNTGTGSATVVVNPLPVVSASPVSVCAGSAPITLSGGTPAGGTFSGTGVSGGQFNPSVGTQTISYSYTDANNCQASANTTVTVNPLPTATISGGGTLCAGSTNTVDITGTLTGTGPWSVVVSTPAGNQTVPSATNTLTIPVGTIGAGTYTIVSVTDAHCTNNTGSGSAVVTVNPTPTVDAVPNQTLCPGASVQAVVFSSPIVGTSYSWTNSNPSIGLAASGNGNIASFTAASSGIATITVTPTSNGCTGTAQTFTITVGTIPTVTFTAPATVCVYNNSFALTPGTPAGGTFSGTGVTGSNFNPATAGLGTHIITYSVTAGCTGTATANIVVSACASIEDIIANDGLAIYPNPTTGNVTFEFANGSDVNVSIVSMEGKTVYQNNFQTTKATVDLNSLARGTYMVRVTMNGKTSTSKLVLN